MLLFTPPPVRYCPKWDSVPNNRRGDREWSLRAFASMPSTVIFLRARAEIKNLLVKSFSCPNKMVLLCLCSLKCFQSTK